MYTLPSRIAGMGTSPKEQLDDPFACEKHPDNFVTACASVSAAGRANSAPRCSRWVISPPATQGAQHAFTASQELMKIWQLQISEQRRAKQLPTAARFSSPAHSHSQPEKQQVIRQSIQQRQSSSSSAFFPSPYSAALCSSARRSQKIQPPAAPALSRTLGNSSTRRGSSKSIFKAPNKQCSAPAASAAPRWTNRRSG